MDLLTTLLENGGNYTKPGFAPDGPPAPASPQINIIDPADAQSSLETILEMAKQGPVSIHPTETEYSLVSLSPLSPEEVDEALRGFLQAPSSYP